MDKYIHSYSGFPDENSADSWAEGQVKILESFLDKTVYSFNTKTYGNIQTGQWVAVVTAEKAV